jgi:hypothetical protein
MRLDGLDPSLHWDEGKTSSCRIISVVRLNLFLPKLMFHHIKTSAHYPQRVPANVARMAKRTTHFVDVSA